MKKIALLAVSLAFFLPAQAAPTSAPPGEAPKFSMPDAQVLRLGLDKFMDAYSAKTHADSTRSMMEGYAYYIRARHSDNQRRAKTLSALNRHRTDAVHHALSDFGDAGADMAEMRSGGGTMWCLVSADSAASREDFMATLMTVVSRPAPQNAAARRRAATLFSKIRSALRQYQNPHLDAYEGFTQNEARHRYRQSWHAAQTAMTRLQALTRDLPDGAASLVAQRAFKEWSDSVADGVQDR